MSMIMQFEIAGCLSGIVLAFIVMVKLLSCNDNLLKKIKDIVCTDNKKIDNVELMFMMFSMYIIFGITGLKMWIFMIPLTVYIISHERKALCNDFNKLNKKLIKIVSNL